MKIRAYQKGELAQMYYPWCGSRQALKRFNADLEAALSLRQQLNASGWTATKRVLSPYQVKLIIDHMGEP